MGRGPRVVAKAILVRYSLGSRKENVSGQGQTKTLDSRSNHRARSAWATLEDAELCSVQPTFPRIGAQRLARRVANGEKLSKKKVTKNFGREAMKKLYRYPGRDAPSKRKGAKFSSIMVPMDVFVRLKELAKFHKCSMSSIMRREINRLFDEAYKQAEVLARIEANRKKNETSESDKPRRRYNV